MLKLLAQIMFLILCKGSLMTDKDQATSDEAVGFGYSGEESVSSASGQPVGEEPTAHTPETATFFPKWRLVPNLQPGQMIAPDERLPMGQSVVMGVQHVVAMFGATVLGPLLMGFDANLAVLMSGIGTLIFFFLVKGQVPSYLGSSFAFIGGVVSVTAYSGSGLNANIGVALGAIIICGLIYTLIGLVIWHFNAKGSAAAVIERLMPPVVTGAIVAVIGLNLAPVAAKGAMASGSTYDAVMAIVTMTSVGLVAVFTRGMLQRLLILVGLVLSYLLYYVFSNLLGFGTPVDLSAVAAAPWFGIPTFYKPEFQLSAITVIAPVAIILVAENLGHIRAVSAMTGRNLDQYLGRAFVGDGVATMVAASVGGTGVTTYGENIGVMSVTRIYSTLIFVIAAIFAIILGFSPKFGALIHSVPAPVLGGVSVVVFGLIAIAGARIWVINRVDFSDNRNLIVAAIAVILGAGNFTIELGFFKFEGIGTATFGAILLYQLLSLKRDNKKS
ncbi:Putative pyrimidine permease RutG [Oligella urethralis]|uniref:Pyrimidine permease RutG n=2 Tax=Oligella urethralis TaxID=90245 RepID=A0A2X1ULI1_9BURK|nr:Putative pyrimidine permease RutG [Oligella urethralis]SUA54555.1 Putative pyrimidine permease RutG [Oligella urethralis]SUA68242.1 Putative pyrimidine permease RutG [Oligella urethralis]SUB14103.1 Putative pyrimidine permease RutG [Oligella urethralis]